jgi:hypothetical protein
MRPDQVCEALVREIRDAQRWSAVEDACHALLNVRRMAGQMEQERTVLTGVQMGHFGQVSQT